MGLSREKIVFADMLRGVACLAVVVEHYGFVFWSPSLTLVIPNVDPIPAGIAPPLIHWALASISATVNLGAFGVALFFLISGFVIPFSVERLDRASFVKARAWRIVPTYAAGFLFTTAALLVAGLCYGNPFPYTAFEVADHLVPGLRLLLGSRFIDYVVWTLEIEVIFYLICAAIAPWLRDGSLLTFAVAVIALLCSFARPDFHPEYLLALVFMLVGTAINFRARDRIDTVTAVMVGTFLLAASIAAMGLIEGKAVAVSYGLAAAVFIASYLARSIFPNLMPLRGLSAVSYPLYVVHGVLGYVAMRIMIDLVVPPEAAFVIAFGLAIAISSALHVLIERPTQRMGRIARPRRISIDLNHLPASSPGLSRRPRLLEHGARIVEVAGTSPATTREK